MKNNENTPQNNSIFEKAVKAYKDKKKKNEQNEIYERFTSEAYKAAVRAANLKQTP